MLARPFRCGDKDIFLWLLLRRGVRMAAAHPYVRFRRVRSGSVSPPEDLRGQSKQPGLLSVELLVRQDSFIP